MKRARSKKDEVGLIYVKLIVRNIIGYDYIIELWHHQR
jgi:hypothetical protein